MAGELLDHLHARHQAAAIVLTYVIWELPKRPMVQSKLRTEIRLIRTSPSVLPSAQILDGLPFLSVILTETMRVYPSSVGPFSRVIPARGAQIDEYHGIPPRTIVSATIIVQS